MKDTITHRNQWYWGNLSTIILHGGLAICDIEEDINDPQKCWLMGVRTLAGHYEKGYGNELLEAAKEEARYMGYHTIQLKALTDSWVVEWYARHGYRITKETEDWTYMEKTI